MPNQSKLMIVRTLLFRQKCTGNNTASLVSASSYSHFSHYLLQCHTGWQILNARPGHYFQQIPRKWPQAHLVLGGAHLQVLQSGDILYDQCLLMNLHPTGGRQQLSHLQSTRELLHSSGRFTIYTRKHRDFKQR